MVIRWVPGAILLPLFEMFHPKFEWVSKEIGFLKFREEGAARTGPNELSRGGHCLAGESRLIRGG